MASRSINTQDLSAPAGPLNADEVRIIAIRQIPMVEEGDDITQLILEAIKNQNEQLQDGDVLVITQRIFSKAQGRVIPLDSYHPSTFAHEYALKTEKDPRLVEAVLQESTRVIRQVGGVLITETKHGFKCANAGVDGSNVGGDDLISLLPENPDQDCADVRQEILISNKIDIAVIMTDTFGRPWRHGQTNVAIGVSGMAAIRDYVGADDLDGKELRVTSICVADEIAGAAELVMGKLDAVPATIIRGYPYDRVEGTAAEIVRETPLDLFP